jgi:hypothetical protein
MTYGQRNFRAQIAREGLVKLGSERNPPITIPLIVINIIKYGINCVFGKVAIYSGFAKPGKVYQWMGAILNLATG